MPIIITNDEWISCHFEQIIFGAEIVIGFVNWQMGIHNRNVKWGQNFFGFLVIFVDKVEFSLEFCVTSVARNLKQMLSLFI